ncbi:MAG: AAA family ATPase [Anaerolineaceae bacterium]|nr:AAA family ATPase [Anaerolineaceae bacterium]MDE0328734.1 AAA family ATPase [Anaerolineaceae bacterium]
MLTKLTIRKFKRFGEKVEIELDNPVVFIGPNNSGKTTALQALALWDIGLRRWKEKRAGKSAPEKRPGVVINRRDLVSIPVPVANLLWHGLRVRDVQKVGGKQRTSNIRIEIVVKGVTREVNWVCGLEFDYANEESLYCRPLRLSDSKPPQRMPVPKEAGVTPVAFLPPMSGLAGSETRLDPGAVEVRIGEGRTAEVLRNLCFQIHRDRFEKWEILVDQIKAQFRSEIMPPTYSPTRGDISMKYLENSVELDLSSAGRGLQQTLLLLAYMYANPGAVLLLDEPDAHLEVIRQHHIYRLLSEVARESGSQIIAASHSEALLNEAADQDSVIAFVGPPHRMLGRSSQISKALKSLGFDQYYQAEQTGWVLYLEGSTDISILLNFARRLEHQQAIKALESPFVKYVGNQLSKAEEHFYGLREAKPNLKGIVLFDQIESELKKSTALTFLMWDRREIENYICTRSTLEAFAGSSESVASFGPSDSSIDENKRVQTMADAIDEIESALGTFDEGSPWSREIKASEKVLEPVFRSFYKRLELPNLMAKKSFYELVKFVPEEEIDPEIIEKLNAIADVAHQAEKGRAH